MRKMKKLVALILAGAMVLGMSMTTMAANEDGKIGTSDDRGMITVSGIDAEDDIEVTAYQIVKVTYDDSNDNFSGYELLYPNVSDPIELDTDAGTIEVTQADLNAIIAVDKVADTDYEMKKTATTADGNATYSVEVPVGSYLVVVSGADAKVYSPMVVSVNYINEDGVNAIAGGTVTTIADGNAWVKESGVPSLTKVEADVIANTDGDFELGNSIDVGNEIDYKLVVNPIPYYGGDHPVFNIVDTLQPGLSADLDTLKVFVDTDKGTKELRLGREYTVAYDEDANSITIDFVVDTLYTLNDYQGKVLSITYRTELVGADNNFNFSGYRNTAKLNFTYDSKVTGRDGSVEDVTYTYTFDLTEKLLKTGADTDGDDVADPLSGATFALYTDADCTVAYTNDLDDDGIYETNADGRLAIKGVEAGTYYLKETKAPVGYSVNTHVYKIQVVAEYDENNGQLTAWGIIVDDTDADSFELNTLTIPNTKLVNLPSTGGIGTTIFTVGGVVIILAAAAMLFARRRVAR